VAVGLRLAALSLRGHSDPERFAAEFSGTERTVTEYLLAEVLERQIEPVRRLLLRTSICERVNGELADLLTGEADGERILQDLEEAGAFVVSVDARRSWFRYHQMFAELLQLELRRSAPGELPALHDAAAGWFATRGFPVEAVRHAQAAEQGIALARGIGRPYLELTGLAHRSELAAFHSLTLAVQRSKEAIEFARQHGWGEEPITGVAYVVLGSTLVGQGRLEEAEPWLARAGRMLRAELEPAAGLVLHHARGMLALARGRDADAMAAFRTAEKLGGLLVRAHPRTTPMRAHLLQAQIRLGETRHAEQALAGLDEETDRGDMRNALAALRLAQGHPQAAAAALRSIIDGSIPGVHPIWLVSALIQEAIARDALGEPDAAGRALERALDAAEPDRVLFPFLVHPALGLLERHARQHTNHAALIWQILEQLAGGNMSSSPTAGPARLREPVSVSETRVLRYLPTNLRVPEIADQLTLSVNTVRTHIRHLYEKLGVHNRTEAVERSRALGLLAPSSRRP
jgi:LuxR family maltose regulon positive regulatory protein